MAYVVDRVVICDAFREPDKHYQLLSGGKSKLAQGRRSSVRFLASARDVKGGIAGVVGKEASLFEDMLASSEQQNDVVNQLRDEVRAWREAGYSGTALVTRRLLEWWFERDEERTNMKKRFFFCQQEAIETVIYLYEVQKRRKMPETGDLIRYALKLATGTGKTLVMALLVTWSTLHKRKVSGSSLSGNFLVLVPNLTVRDRVSGVPRGDGLTHSGEHNLYDAFDMVPSEYHDEFHPNVLVRNWQGIPLVQSVSHILGLRAFGSPLLTEQIIGRGLRRTNYDILNQPLEERPKESDETVDAFGIPFVGFPVEKRKRPKTGEWGKRPVWIEPDAKKEKFRVRVPNVRSWAVGVVESLADLVRVEELPEIRVNPRETPPDVHVRPVVGGQPEVIMTLEQFRREWPLLKTAFFTAEELFDATNPGAAADLGIGPT